MVAARTLPELNQRFADNHSWDILPVYARELIATVVHERLVTPQQFADGAPIDDGETDATPAFAAALADLKSKGGGALFLPPAAVGYLVGPADGSLFTIDFPCDIFGTGLQSRILAAPGFGEFSNIFLQTGDHCTFRNFYMNLDPSGGHSNCGRGINPQGTSAGILSDVAISGVRIDHARRAGVRCEGFNNRVEHVRITDCIFYDCRASLALDGTIFDCTMQSVDIWEPWADGGISIDRLTAGTTSRAINIKGVNIFNSLVPSGGNQAAIRGRMEDSVISGVVIDVGVASGVGMSLASSQRLSVQDVNIRQRETGTGTGLAVLGLGDSLITGVKVSGFGTGVNGDANTTNNKFQNNDFSGNTNNFGSALGAGNIRRNNAGYVTENKGTATIPSDGTSVTFAHGLSVTPAVQDFSLSFSSNPLANVVGVPWISNITSTEVTVSVPSWPGGSGWTFGWRVEVL